MFVLMRLSVPADPLQRGAWLAGDTSHVALAMNLVPFAGVAFLWFVSILRDRLGEKEDQFFATVFLGSSFLVLTMMFAAAAALARSSLHFMPLPTRSRNQPLFVLGVYWPTD